jgi:hypothetical protein
MLSVPANGTVSSERFGTLHAIAWTRVALFGTGAFLPGAEYGKRDSRDAFRSHWEGAYYLQVLRQPNLQKDCCVRLPNDILKALQDQLRSSTAR